MFEWLRDIGNLECISFIDFLDLCNFRCHFFGGALVYSSCTRDLLIFNKILLLINI